MQAFPTPARPFEAHKISNVLRILLLDAGTTRPEINEPIGIGALASYVRQQLGDQVEISQRLVPIHDLPSESEMAQLDVVGLSLRLYSLAKMRSVVASIRRLPLDQRPLLVLGDVLATFAPQEILAEVPEAICVLGEGEEALAGIAQGRLAAGRDRVRLLQWLQTHEVPNLAWNDGAIKFSARKLLDLGKCPPPDRGLIDAVRKVNGIVRAEGSRGCAWGRCSFCAIQAKYCNQISWREIPVERTVEEFVELSQHGVRSLYFTDEDFIGNNPTRALQLAKRISEEKARGRIAHDLSFYVDLRVQSLIERARTDAPRRSVVLAALREAGLREVFLGIESGTAAQVHRYQKGVTENRNLKAIWMLRGLGIEQDIGFIMFDPEMTLDEIKQNLAFLSRATLWTHDARMTKALRLAHGTPLVDRYRAKNLIAGPLDVDGLCYPYRWLDRSVEAVFEAFSSWQNERATEVYAVEAATRGEVPDEATRIARRKRLGSIRAVELDVLSHLVLATSSGGNPLRLDLDRFRKRRDKLLLGCARFVDVETRVDCA